MRAYRVNKSCDQCRNRKVRCNVLPGQKVTCTHCKRRNENCQFSTAKRIYRADINSTGSDESRSREKNADLFIDRLLRNSSEEAVLYDEFSIIKAYSSLAIFSEQRLNSLTERLGSSRLRILVNGLDDRLRMHLKKGSAAFSTQTSTGSDNQVRISLEERKLYIDSYFDHVQPIYPFLNRAEFEASAFRPDITQLNASNLPFSALYHAVLALGCLYKGGGGYDAGIGRSWELFTEAKRHLSDILIGRESLQSLQSIFSMTPCCLQVNHPLLSQASHMVLALRYHKSSVPDSSADACQRLFWVIYHLDKQYNFQARRSSVIADYDICCPLPAVGDSVFGNYDWFRASISFCRILSSAYETVFSVSAMMSGAIVQLAAIDRIRELLEDWRTTIPVQFRPHEAHQGSIFRDLKSRNVAIQTNYYYYHLVIALERLTIHLDREGNRQDSRRQLMNAARAVIELTKYIDVEAYTPVFIQAIMPLSALLILFDFIIHNPRHTETASNLALLDVVSGHFSLLELASNGSLPGSYLTEFAHIARQFINQLPEYDSLETGQTGATNPDLLDESIRADINPPLKLTDQRSGLHERSEVSESLYYPSFEEDINNFDMNGLGFWSLFESQAFELND
ncbi:fungal-specific transcription factor domain-containing protein [Aspergillus spinulosporus]